MVVAYVIFALIVVSIIYGTIKALRNKRYTDLVFLLFMIPFLVFFISSAMLGGSAFSDAANSYASYEQGHYYLVNHGNYTEVSYSVYLYMYIIQIIGLVSFGIGFILCLLFFILKNKSKGNKKRKEANQTSTSDT